MIPKRINRSMRVEAIITRASVSTLSACRDKVNGQIFNSVEDRVWSPLMNVFHGLIMNQAKRK
jgi:hypothetical protein